MPIFKKRRLKFAYTTTYISIITGAEIFSAILNDALETLARNFVKIRNEVQFIKILAEL